MKIHNIASIGIFAAIFGGMVSAHATTIASKEYVDARVDTKQNKLAVGTNVTVDSTSNTTAADSAITNVTTDSNGNVTFVSRPISVAAPAATTYVTNGTNVLDSSMATATDKAPSITAVKGMKQDKQELNTGETIANVTQYTSTTTNGDKKVPTVQAVGQQFEKFANTHNNVLTSGITSTKVGNYDDAYAAAVTNAIASNIISAADDYLVKTNAIKKSVLYYNNNATTNTHAANVGAAGREVTAQADILTRNNTVKINMDDYIPTVAAVEARVQAVHDEIPDTTTTKSATYSSTNHTLTVASTGDGASTTKVATPKQVANTITDVKSYVDYKAGLKADKASNLTAATNKYNTVKYNADGVVIAGNDLTALADVNSTSGASCDENNPCVLTYYKKSGATFMRWTPMMTESTSANTSATTSGDTAASS